MGQEALSLLALEVRIAPSLEAGRVGGKCEVTARAEFGGKGLAGIAGQAGRFAFAEFILAGVLVQADDRGKGRRAMARDHHERRDELARLGLVMDQLDDPVGLFLAANHVGPEGAMDREAAQQPQQLLPLGFQPNRMLLRRRERD